jgi:heat shock protein HtpX
VDVRREFRADERGAKLTGNPIAMANAIRTLEKEKHRLQMTVVPAVAHLFMVSPFAAGRIARLLDTHPPMDERIARLHKMHDGSIRPSVHLRLPSQSSQFEKR